MSSIQVILAGTASMQIISLRLTPSDNDVISLLWINKVYTSAVIRILYKLQTGSSTCYHKVYKAN